MAFMGAVPFGSLLGGVGCVLGSLGFARALPSLRQTLRPLYVRGGILPEVAAGL